MQRSAHNSIRITPIAASLAASHYWRAFLRTGFWLLLLLALDVAFVEPSTAAPFQWQYTGSMATARTSHTATLLLDGRVLVVGGFNGTYLASAEIYDPATGMWSATGSLTTGRRSHTATLLSDGRVLVAGGYHYPGGYLASCELYDPATGMWTATGDLTEGRYGHTATLLPNGQVLVAGGGGSRPLNSSELYDPATGMWTLAGLTDYRFVGHTQTLLANGQVLVVGGGFADNKDQYLAAADLYDPVTGTWSLTGSLNKGREEHTATLLTDGRVLVTGGYKWKDFALGSSELYDPATGTWSYARQLNDSRYLHTATLLHDGTVLVAGGKAGLSYQRVPIASAELYHPAKENWTLTGSLNTARVGHTATLLANGQVLVTGGTGSDILASAELYDPGAE